MAASPSARFPLTPAHGRHRAARCRRDRRVRRADHHDPGQRQRHRRAGPHGVGGVLEPTAPAEAPTEPAVGEPAPGRRQGGAGTGHPLRPPARRATGRRSAPRRPQSAVPAPAPAPAEPAPPAVAAPAPAPAPGGGLVRRPRAPARLQQQPRSRGSPRGRRRTSESAGWTVDEIGGFPGRHPGRARSTTGRARTSRRRRRRLAAPVRAASPSRGSPRSRAPGPGVIVIVTRDYAERGQVLSAVYDLRSA